MPKKLILKTSHAATLLEMIHELGVSFYEELSRGVYRVVYFTGNKEVYFEGKLTEEEIAKLIESDSIQAKSITIDEGRGEIIIEE